MKKYKLKIAQGSIPANMEFTNWEDYIEVFNEDNQTIIYYDIKDIPLLLEQGIIEEVQELKWTDNNMIDFAETMILVAKLKNNTECSLDKEDYVNGINVYTKNSQNKERI